jgi:hypothetical protein
LDSFITGSPYSGIFLFLMLISCILIITTAQFKVDRPAKSVYAS